MPAAEDYLREISSTMSERYLGDCLKYARAIHELLVAEGRDPWIGRIRKISRVGHSNFHGPLNARRFRGRGGTTWTSHYVCCCDDQAYDPIIGAVVPLAEYAVAVFGEALEVERLPP